MMITIKKKMDEDVDNDDSSCSYDNDDWVDDEDAAELKKNWAFVRL